MDWITTTNRGLPDFTRNDLKGMPSSMNVNMTFYMGSIVFQGFVVLLMGFYFILSILRVAKKVKNPLFQSKDQEWSQKEKEEEEEEEKSDQDKEEEEDEDEDEENKNKEEQPIQEEIQEDGEQEKQSKRDQEEKEKPKLQVFMSDGELSEGGEQREVRESNEGGQSQGSVKEESPQVVEDEFQEDENKEQDKKEEKEVEKENEEAKAEREEKEKLQRERIEFNQYHDPNEETLLELDGRAVMGVPLLLPFLVSNNLFVMNPPLLVCLGLAVLLFTVFNLLNIAKLLNRFPLLEYTYLLPVFIGFFPFYLYPHLLFTS